MGRKRKNEDDRQALALAAARHAAKGMLQEDIAQKMALMQPEVSRLLQFARQAKWLQPSPSIVRHEVPDAIWERVEREHFSAPGDLDALVKAWAPRDHLVKVHVVSSVDHASFGTAAAHFVAAILADAEIVGITWGPALAGVIRGLARTYAQARANRDYLRVIPLCGEPFFADSSRIPMASSSRLAEDLEVAANGSQELSAGRPSLYGVPAYIPTSFDADDRRVLTRFLRMNPGYRDIYGAGREKGLIDDVQTIITGVGALPSGDTDNSRMGVFLSERLACEKLGEGQLDHLVLGDIGGVLLPRENLLGRQRKAVEDLNSGWTGASLAHLKRCARDGAKTRKRRGVVVIAEGAEKARLIREIVKLGAVNELVLGHQLAAAVDALDRSGASASGNG